MIDSKLVSFVKLRKINPLTEWDDIKEGEIYHIPPLVYNKRMDFIVKEKKLNSMKIVRLGYEYQQTMFRTDITSRFIIKKRELHGMQTWYVILWLR